MKIPQKALPKFAGLKERISGDADNKDLRTAILAAVPQAVEQTKDLAPYFKTTNERETAKKIFDFLKSRVKYKADDYRQVIQLPSAILRPGAIADCKSLSLFTASILQNLGIPWHFVLTSYSDSPIPGHIYVETDSGIIIDVVWGKFDSEKKPKYRYTMKNKDFSPTLGKTDQPLNGWLKDKANQFTNWAKEKVTDVGDFVQDKTGIDIIGGAKTISLSPGRSLFLIIVKNNLDGMASKLQKIDQGNLREAWNKAGGNWTNLTEAIRKGASRRSINIGLLKGISKLMGIQGIGQTKVEQFFSNPANVTALIALTTSIGTVVGTAVGSATGPGAVVTGTTGGGAGASLGGVLTAMAKILPPLLALMSAQDKGNPEPVIVQPEPAPPQPEQKNYTGLIIGGAVIATGVLIYLATKKKK
jgi:hypothetical protein